MNINVEIKIKLDNGTEIILKDNDAKELYFKLKELYEQKETYIPYPVYPTYPVISQPWKWHEPWYTYPVITCGGDHTITEIAVRTT
jgi:hypothetical protein